MDITGTLEGWQFEQISAEEGIIVGFIFGDAKGRFPDGTLIHTSGLPYSQFKQGDVVQTRNSTYKLGASIEEVLRDAITRSMDTARVTDTDRADPGSWKNAGYASEGEEE